VFPLPAPLLSAGCSVYCSTPEPRLLYNDTMLSLCSLSLSLASPLGLLYEAGDHCNLPGNDFGLVQ